MISYMTVSWRALGIQAPRYRQATHLHALWWPLQMGDLESWIIYVAEMLSLCKACD